MDAADLKRKALASRQVQLEVAKSISFTLTLPTTLESSIAYSQASKPDDGATMPRFQRALVLLAVTGWSGVTANHVLTGEGAEAVPFDQSLTPVLLDAKPDWEEKLTHTLLDELAKRKEVRDTAVKN